MKPTAAINWQKEFVLFIALFGLEACVFYAQLQAQITPFYPTNFDQANFIHQVYTLYADFVGTGWLSLIEFPFKTGSPTGTGLLVQGALAAIIGGPNRTALLTLNLLYFFVLQVILFLAIFTRTRNVGFARLAIAILIACPSIFNAAGGMFDFRFDFSAMCLFGIWVGIVVMSRTFRDRKLAIAAALVAALLIVDRYVSIAYVASISAGTMAVLLWSAMTSRPVARAFAMWRLRNCVHSSIIVAIFVLPFFASSIAAIYQKYVGGHLLDSEKYMRAAEVGIHGVMGHLLFYPRSIIFDHIGAPAFIVSATLLLIASVATIVGRVPRQEIVLRGIRCRYEFIFLILSIAVPVIILTIDIAKSTVVGGIVIAPIILAFILFFTAIFPSSQSLSIPTKIFRFTTLGATRAKNRWQAAPYFNVAPLAALQVVIIILALGSFLAHGIARQHLIPRVELERINEINKTIVQYAVENEIRNPNFSIDRIVDYLWPYTLYIMAFENFGINLPINFGLGYDTTYGFNATPRAAALQFADKSDILVLTDPTIGRDSPYPLNAEIKTYWNDLMSWAVKNRLSLFKTTILGVPYEVFVKPQLRVAGASSDGWITDAGVTIEADAALLKRWQFILLRGQTNFGPLHGVPHAHATVMHSMAPQDEELPVSISSNGSRYEIIIDTRSIASASSKSIHILLTFDRSFVPLDLGINGDTRHLVIRAPTSTEMRDSPPNYFPAQN